MCVLKTGFALYQRTFYGVRGWGPHISRLWKIFPNFPRGTVINSDFIFSLKDFFVLFLVCCVFNCNCVNCLYMYAVSGTTYTITGPYKKNLYFGQAIGLDSCRT
jgi:hypothetical protein